MPADTSELPEGINKYPGADLEGQEGINDFGEYGYNGPCPPSGNEHRYYFKLYALDTVLDLSSGAKKQELLDIMEDHIIAYGELKGTYIY